MSKRRHVREVVWKKNNAGFFGPACLVRTVEFDGDELPPCMLPMCTDPDCKEWPNVERLDLEGLFMGMLYHVSECEMEDYPPT